jgi:hypothetical protein
MAPDGRYAARGDEMKQYLLTMYQPQSGVPDPVTLANIMKEVHTIRRELQEAGQWVFAGGLHPPETATVVRVDRGEMLTSDGPFVESKEHIGGFTIIRAPDLDDALEWARRYAKATTLPIEVRPFQDEPPR